MLPTIRRTLLVLGGWLFACVAPRDVGDEVFVTVETGSAVIVQGRGISLTARAWHRSGEGELEQVGGVTYLWRAKDEGIVSIADSGSRATVIGVSRGTDSVFAIPVDYRGATPGAVQVRVSAAVEIDRVTPGRVRYGEEVTVTGVGLGQAARFALGEANLIPEPGSFSGDSAGLGSLRLWVPFPARSDQLVAVSGEGSSTVAPDQTAVDPLDLFEPNDTVPATIRLDAPTPSGSDTLFYNPALALEQDGAADRYRLLAGDTTRALTVVITSGSTVPASFEADLGVPGEAWSLGIRDQHCRQDTTTVTGIVPDTLTRALAGLPSGGLVLAVRGPPSRYSVTILDGYHRQNPAIGPDRFEKNDNCTAADDPARRIDLSTAFADTLTIDNGYELDWFRIGVPGTTPQLVTVRTAALPFGAVDSSDVALALFPAPVLGDSALTRSDAPGSTEELTAELEPGEYYLLVADRGGVATRYTLCIVRGTGC